MKKVTLLLFIFQCSFTFAQFNPTAPWMDNVQKSDSKEATIDEIKSAFDAYWQDKNHKAKGSGYKPFMRWETHWRNKVDENGYLMTPAQMWEAWNQKRERSLSRNEILNDISNWEPLGPFNHINTGSWSSGQGRVNVVVVDPNNPNTIYIGAPAGGIWKSTDAGLNWTPLSDYLPQIGVSGIAIDHTNSDIIYIATGDKDASDTYSIGVLKSTDGGFTWNTTGLTFNNTSTVAADIFMHPDDPLTLWVATSAGLFKTSNGGTTWTNNLNGNVKDLKLKPGNPNIVYAVTNNRFYRSTNGGNSFTMITSGMPTNSGRLIIDVTPANPEYVYVLSARTNWSHQGLYKSTNSGINFTVTENTVDIFEANQAWFDLALAVSDTNPEEVYTGVLNIWKSSDGGNNFTKINNWSNPFQATYTHADIHFLRFYDGVLYCGSDGGVYVSSNNAASFTDLTATAQIGQFYRISVSKQSSSKIAGGLQDNGGYALSNNQWKNFYGADGMETAIDPNNSNKYYGFIQNGGGLYFTNNAGASLSGSIGAPEGEDGNWITPLVFNSVGELYAGYSSLYKLVGNNWQNVSINTSFDGNIERIVIDPSNDDILYIADGQDLYKSTNRGETFDFLFSFSSNITSIEVNVHNNNMIYITCSGINGVVSRSVNGGLSFANFAQGLPPIGRNVIKHQSNHPLNPVYLGTSLGVYYRDDSMNSWIPYDTNLPNVTVTDLEINVLDGKIIASTYGRGVWQSPIPSQLAENEIALLSIENPAASVINCNTNSLSFLVKNTGSTTITDFTVNYSINGIDAGYNWNGTLASLATTTVEIPNITLIRGNSIIQATIVMENDTFSNNNALNIEVSNNDGGQVGVVNTFETEESTLLSNHEGSENSWQRGIPTGTLLNQAASGANVYATNLDGNYLDFTKAYLYSQCYDLTPITNPIMRFKLAFDIEENWDVLYVEYSTDFGQNWAVLGTADDPNWYNSNRTPETANDCEICPGAQWTGTNTNLLEYSYPLNAFTNESNLIFRFVFHSDYTVTNEGAVIDDFVIDGTLSTPDFENTSVAVYPNPTKGIFTVSYGNNSPNQIDIYDVTGKNILSVRNTDLTDNQTELNLSNASNGIYFVKISNEKGQTVKRIIKN
ncbi:T9SS type A sorting domain-containing protein [Flavobacterium piscinae]|uniref:T9SS type A sorting domain-containing protein n=1 Tax=Flavobacterium piscinae TaxID=2506424 RepID=A0A4Q1KV16_9FLAO|nr:T9SS type A sorting domain-containing protein [Flavobacterium piscinae]MBC8883759.1 T9SS type A sorting domain-containing protein [Flavobacterium piscinae]RXR33500.1 T9SS type A sorting domain-containing protein [Flavobacterium piscinae]